MGSDSTALRRVILTTYGFHLAEVTDELPAAAAAVLFGLQGFTETAVRSAFRRLRGDDVIATRRVGRRTAHALTHRGRDLVTTQLDRYHSRTPPLPDGRWLVVVARSADPRAARRLRLELDQRGFGSLVPGVRVHRLDQRDEVAREAERLGIDDVTLFTSDPVGRPPLAATAWDLDALAAAWDAVVAGLRDLPPRPTGEAAYLANSWLLAAYTDIAAMDPFLPPDDLPRGHPSVAGREQVGRALTHTAEAARAYVAEVVGEHRLPDADTARDLG